MLEICFVLAMCFISFVHSCHYLLYSHGFSFLTEVTNTALGDLILCCCVCVCAHCLPACVCIWDCVCVPVYVIFPSILIHVHTDIINTATCTVYLYITVIHVLLANIRHAYVIGKHQSHIFWQMLVCTFCIKTMCNASAKWHKHNRAPYMWQVRLPFTYTFFTIHRLCSSPPTPPPASLTNSLTTKASQSGPAVKC